MSRFATVAALGPLLSRVDGRTFAAFTLDPDRDDPGTVTDLLASGAVRSVVDRRYPLREVPEAIRYLEAGRATGTVVVTVGESGGEPGTR